jgi:hypothetical protein
MELPGIEGLPKLERFTNQEVAMAFRRTALAGAFAIALSAGLMAYAGIALPDRPQAPTAGKESPYWPVVKECLAAWGETQPFKDEPALRFRIIEPDVKVLGIGADITDSTQTSEPELILLRPAVNVMSKMTFHLMNPNGWYCFEKNITVMAKSEVSLACSAHVAAGSGGATVMGSSPGQGGATVMGKTVFERNCQQAAKRK